MGPKVARGFLMLLLNNEQVTQIWKKENSLPQGRFLAPWEISKLLGVQCGAKTEAEISQMESLEVEWGKQIWKQRKIEELGETQERTDQDECHDWDQFVIANWDFAKEVRESY